MTPAEQSMRIEALRDRLEEVGLGLVVTICNGGPMHIIYKIASSRRVSTLMEAERVGGLMITAAQRGVTNAQQ